MILYELLKTFKQDRIFINNTMYSMDWEDMNYRDKQLRLIPNGTLNKKVEEITLENNAINIYLLGAK